MISREATFTFRGNDLPPQGKWNECLLRWSKTLLKAFREATEEPAANCKRSFVCGDALNLLLQGLSRVTPLYVSYEVNEAKLSHFRSLSLPLLCPRLAFHTPPKHSSFTNTFCQMQ